MIFIDYDASVVGMGEGDEDSSLSYISSASVIGSMEEVDEGKANSKLSLHLFDYCVIKPVLALLI